MSSTTVKTATEESSQAKPHGATKKVAKTTARKTRAGTTGAAKKVTAKKAVSKKSAVKKTRTRKKSDKTVHSEHLAAAKQQQDPAQQQVSPTADHNVTEDTRSLSWMSAQAASALKAVKASQAEKGQAVLARTRKQSTEKQLDDDSLIRIAAEMPVDNDALVEFSTEESLQEQPQLSEATVAAVMDETSGITGSSDDSSTPESSSGVEDNKAEVTTASTGQTQPALPTPPARRAVAFQPALAAGLLFAALLLGYYFWPESNDNSVSVATQESSEIEAPAAATEPVEPQGTTVADIATTPVAEPQQESATIDHASTPTAAPLTGVPSVQPQTAAAPPATEPEPAPVRSSAIVAPRTTQPTQAAQVPVYSQPVTEPEPGPAGSSAIVAPRTTQPAKAAQVPVYSQPVTEPEPGPAGSSAVVAPRATQPAQAAQAPVHAQPAVPAQPTVPAQTNRRAPVQGYYPQQRRPAYPQYYYR